jgi:hypothetical protein
LRDHARSCEGCRQILIAQRRLLDLLHRTAPAAVDGGRMERLVEVLQAEVRRRTCAVPSRTAGLVYRLAAGGAVVAASLLLVAMATWLTSGARGPLGGKLATWRSGSPPSPPHVAGRSAQRHLPAVALARPPGKLPGPPQDRREPPLPEGYRLSWHPADLLLEAPRLPNHWQTYRPTVDELVVAIPRVTQRLDDVDQWAPGLRPLKLSLVRVWEALWPATTWWHQEPPERKPQTGDTTTLDGRRWT